MRRRDLQADSSRITCSPLLLCASAPLRELFPRRRAKKSLSRRGNVASPEHQRRDRIGQQTQQQQRCVAAKARPDLA
jgi:hypothetical protein